MFSLISESANSTPTSDETMKVTKPARSVTSGAGNSSVYRLASSREAWIRASKAWGSSLNSRIIQRAWRE